MSKRNYCTEQTNVMKRFKSEIASEICEVDVHAFSSVENDNSSDSSNEDDEGVQKDSLPKKKYKQRPRKAWFHNPYLKNWIIIDGNKTKCRYCELTFKNVKYSSLKGHSFSKKHMRAAKIFNENNLENDPTNNITMSNFNSDFESESSSSLEDNLTDSKPSLLESEDLKDFKEGHNVSPKHMNEEDFMSMRLAIEKDKVKAIGDMTKQVSSAIRYLADSIRLAFQQNNTSKDNV